MNNQPLRVGLIGANPDQSWAALSHLPAIAVLPDVKLVAVGTSRPETARAAGEAFGVDEFYSDAKELAASPNVDVVSVAVKVPLHATLVNDALDAGKNVMCEWPLGATVEEAQSLVERAKRSGVRTAVNLQSRFSPAARRARDLIQNGALGRVLSANIISTTTGFGGQTARAYVYFDDPASGANLSTITAGHTLDLAIYLLGAITQISALGSIKTPLVEIMDAVEGELKTVARTLFDHLAIAARFESGCLLSCEVDGGRPAPMPFVFEIIGEEGTLTLRGGSPFGFQGGELTLEASVPFEKPDAPAAPELQGPLANVGELYQRFARDIARDEHQTPDFAHAVRLQKLIASVNASAQSGMAQNRGDWPTS